MSTILLSVTCEQLTYNTRVLTSIHSLITISVYVCRLLCCNAVKIVKPFVVTIYFH